MVGGNTPKNIIETSLGGNKEMTEQLREKILNERLYPMLQRLGVVVDCKLSGFKMQEIMLGTAVGILADYKEALPELAREAGYVKLANFGVVTTVPQCLPDTVWFSMSYEKYKELLPDGKLLKE